MFETAASSHLLDLVSDERPATGWGVASETGRLTDVLLSAPAYLAMVPCNDVTRDNLAKGLLTSPAMAARQHRAFAAALESAGVRCHYVRPRDGMPDLSFTRDAVLMSPWGLVELRPAARHRRAETTHVATAVHGLGAPVCDRIEEGYVEGGDVCLLRDGLVVIGHSNERTTKDGSQALGKLFAKRGWEVIHTRFDPRYLHLDTVLTMVAEDCAVVCPEAVEDVLLGTLLCRGIDVIPASLEEVAGLHANLLSLGDGRVVTASGNDRLNIVLTGRGIEVIEVDIDQFTRCGGGPHCLTMPLARLPSR